MSRRSKNPAGKRSRNNPYGRVDRFQKLAKKQGYSARSVFKLEEIDRRLSILRPRHFVIDLGASPGSWTTYASQRVGAGGLVLALDLNALAITTPPNVHFIQGDFFEISDDELRSKFPEAILEKGGVNVVLSDMAPKTTGHRSTDQHRSHHLFMGALELASRFLRRGGNFVGKIFQGPDFEEARHALRQHFEEVKIVRPEATRTVSYEVFLVGRRFKGSDQATQNAHEE